MNHRIISWFCSILLFQSNYVFAEESGGMPQLNPEYYSSQIFWLIFFFSILFLLSHFYFLPKITSIRSKREELINECISESKKINDEIETIVAKMEQDLEKAKEDFDVAIKKAFDQNKEIYEEKIKLINEGFENKKVKLSKNFFDSKIDITKNIQKYSISLSDQIYQIIMKEKIKGNVNEFKEIIGEDS
ncbi:MAG: hypothetical protein CMM99_02830 [Rickettsiales bacterium]|nr:hypothetical protein [Rickettsiales bacterium]MAZ07386.1 hypothetical protein [Rickettsiales bacterium]